jgi:hypothetical protein
MSKRNVGEIRTVPVKVETCVQLGSALYAFQTGCLNLCLLTYLLTHCMEQSPSCEVFRFPVSQKKNSSYFMETESLLPHLQAPATCPYLEPDGYSPYLNILFPEDPS